MSAWTATAITRIKATLVGDARLASYNEAVVVRGRLRDDEVPDIQRHGIVVVPGDLVVNRWAVSHNKEEFSVYLRLFIKPWGDPDDEETLLTADTVVGVGTSTVGMLRFMEDVKNALRANELTELCESTALEADAQPDLSTVPIAALDTHFYIATLRWRGEASRPHDPDAR